MPKLEVDTGRHIYFERYGGTKVPLVLVHGWGTHSRVWDMTLPALLRAGHEVVLLDQRAFGRSDKDFDVVSVAACASDVVALVEAAHLERPIVVGWSFGAAVTAEAAISRSAALRGVVLVGPPTPRFTQASDFPYGAAPEALDEMFAALHGNRPAFLRALADGVCHSDDVATAEWLWQMFLQAGPRADDGLADLGQIDQRTLLPTVELPALICAGARDAVVDPAIAVRAADLMPNARLLGFAESGHAPFLDEAEKFNAALLDFAGSLEHATGLPG